MNDHLESSPKVEEASNKAKHLVELSEKGGFNFASNVDSLPVDVEHNSETATTREKVIPKWNHASYKLVLGRWY